MVDCFLMPYGTMCNVHASKRFYHIFIMYLYNTLSVIAIAALVMARCGRCGPKHISNYYHWYFMTIYIIRNDIYS